MRYLLGQLSEQEKTSLEERFFSDDQEFEELEIAETELIDQYLRDELSASDRTLFEKKLAKSPRLVERVQIGRILASRLHGLTESQTVATTIKDIVPTPRVSWWGKLFGSQTRLSPAFATAVVLVLVAGVALAIVWSRYRSESQRLAAETQQRVELEKQIAELKSRSDSLDQTLQQTIRDKEELLARINSLQSGGAEQLSKPAVFFLTAGGVRSGGGDGKTFNVASTATSIELLVDVTGGHYGSYNAVIQTPERSVIKRAPGLLASQSRGRKTILIRLETKQLPSGDYVVEVEGVTPTGTTEPFNTYTLHVRVK